VTTQGQLLPVWQDAWPRVWVPLARKARGLDHPDLFCELFRGLNGALRTPKSAGEMAQITSDVDLARREFRKIKTRELKGENEVVAFFEGSHEILDELGGDALANPYFVLLGRFLERFGLRYDLRRPCHLCPTLQGVFSSLVSELRELTARDAHLDSLMKDFEGAVRDLSGDSSGGRIKTCIQKQMNLLEALGTGFPGVTETELGSICNQIGTWPHTAVKSALKNLYGFASNYPGIRHAGNPASAIRAIDMRDMVALSILLAGFTPYLSHQLDAEVVYKGS
jgi:hypothetical protein